jgi:predicted NUDIX family NTP pyrophosphohydrolase
VPPRPSAGLLLHRTGEHGLEVLLAHPGGPLWARKDAGAWSIPKGEYGPDEAPLDAARREFTEEIGSPPPPGRPLPLGSVRQRNGKIVTAWALPGDLDVTTVVSNTFEMEWPPRSGRRQQFPEIDRAAWFDVPAARTRIVAAQADFLDRLVAALAG